MEGLESFASDPDQRARLERQLDQTVSAEAKKLAPLDVRDFLYGQVAANLAEKEALRGPRGERFAMSPLELRREVFEYEAFKLEAFLGSGVFPKRYFGYLDRKWDTAPYEAVLLRTARRAVQVTNAQLAAAKSPTRITEAEVLVTFLAEGGARVLLDHQDELERIPPVAGIGLDDIAVGFGRYPGLVAALDAALGTRLGEVVGRGEDGQPRVTRAFSFAEAVAGTVAMWAFEKERCAGLLAKAGRPPLSTLTPEQQFVVGSLVYNSGLTFDPERLEQIRSFSTGDYLFGVSETSKPRRPELPVLPAARAWAALEKSGRYPDQQTSWSGVYHVLQRYGAYVALARFTDWFDERGMLRAER